MVEDDNSSNKSDDDQPPPPNQLQWTRSKGKSKSKSKDPTPAPSDSVVELTDDELDDEKTLGGCLAASMSMQGKYYT